MTTPKQVAEAMIDAHGRDAFSVMFEREARLLAIRQQECRIKNRIASLRPRETEVIATATAGLARLKALAKEVRSSNYDPKKAMVEAVLKNDGPPISGLIFDRGRSTLAAHLAAVKRVVQLLKRYKRVPIVVDDSGEGSYDGWALSVCYDKRALKESASLFDEWQVMAGIVVWQRFVNDSSKFFRACDPGWHWISVDEDRRVEMRGQLVSWTKATRTR